jgi:Bacterial Ig domain/RTX calcium-binding nonapeptide repeat (4 copies)
VSTVADGSEGSGAAGNNTSISADGRYIGFDSGASNLSNDDNNNATDVFLVDRQSNKNPVARNDALVTNAAAPLSGNAFADNGDGIDSDPEHDALTVFAVNGLASNIGHYITLTSGALLVVNPDGRFVYDPNGKFDGLDIGQTARDHFTYAISDGQGNTSTATVSLTISGSVHGLQIADGSGTINGTAADDQIAGGPDSDIISGGPGYDWLQGGGGADQLIGGNGSDALFGDDGDDILDGGPDTDTMTGGRGDDTYHVDNAGDQITERSDGGYDIVSAASNYTLSPDVEALVLTDNESLSAVGNATDNMLVGDATGGSLSGAGGDDLILGRATDVTSVFSGARTDYSIVFDTDNFNFTVSDQRDGSPDRTDTVNGVTHFQFSDGTVDASELTRQAVTAADGSRTERVYDAADIQPWWTKVSSFDDANRLTSETFYQDNGTIWTNAFDAADMFSWSRTTTLIDGRGNLVSQTITNDDGLHSLTAHDGAGSADWAEFHILFDADWNWTSAEGMNDDGIAMSAGAIAAAYDLVRWSPSPVTFDLLH